MAVFSMQLDSENAAFTEEGGQYEVARLLRHVAERIDAGADCGLLTDYNGNRVGRWEFEATEAGYACDDCGQDAIEEAEGQTCGQCGRGIISEVTR